MLTAQRDGLGNTRDSVILDCATSLGRVIFSMDVAFLREAKERQASNVPFSGVVFAHQRHVNIGDCVHDLELIGTICEPSDLASKGQFLPL